MIYRAVAETREDGKPKAYHIFIHAGSEFDANVAISDLCRRLFPAGFEVYNLLSESELLTDWALFPKTFPDAHLVECGAFKGSPVYIDSNSCVKVLPSDELVRLDHAIEHSKKRIRANE